MAAIGTGTIGSIAVKEEVADPADEVGTLPGNVAAHPLMGNPSVACCNRDACLYSQQWCCELATLY